MLLFKLFSFLVVNSFRVLLLVFLAIYVLDYSGDLLGHAQAELAELDAHRVDSFLREKLENSGPAINQVGTLVKTFTN